MKTSQRQRARDTPDPRPGSARHCGRQPDGAPSKQCVQDSFDRQPEPVSDSRCNRRRPCGRHQPSLFPDVRAGATLRPASLQPANFYTSRLEMRTSTWLTVCAGKTGVSPLVMIVTPCQECAVGRLYRTRTSGIRHAAASRYDLVGDIEPNMAIDQVRNTGYSRTAMSVRMNAHNRLLGSC